MVRLGHAVLGVSDFRRSEQWYKERFGFITSDEIAVSPEMSIGAFMRCDRGDTPTDHHTLFLLQGPDGVGFHHAAFEVVDVDDLMAGHDQLAEGGWTPEWGIGRHLLGSQVFDYWKDPWGNTLEHWTDGDLFTAADGSNTAPLPDLLAVQWGPTPPFAARLRSARHETRHLLRRRARPSSARSMDDRIVLKLSRAAPGLAADMLDLIARWPRLEAEVRRIAGDARGRGASPSLRSACSRPSGGPARSWPSA